MMQNFKVKSGRKCLLPTLLLSKSVAGVRVKQRFRPYQTIPRDGGFSRCGTCFAFFSQRYHKYRRGGSPIQERIECRPEGLLHPASPDELPRRVTMNFRAKAVLMDIPFRGPWCFARRESGGYDVDKPFPGDKQCFAG